MHREGWERNVGLAQDYDGFPHQACAHVPHVTLEAMVPESASSTTEPAQPTLWGKRPCE